MSETLTPGQCAKMHGISIGKVYLWIDNGSLHAMNMATIVGRRPRWRLYPADIAAFEAARSNAPAIAPQRRQQKASTAVEYV